MDNKDTESMVGGVENKGLLSFDISSVKGHTFAVVHASCQNEDFKADTHNLSRSFFEEGATTNLGSSNLEEVESSSSEEEVASSVVAPEYTSHSTRTVPIMDNKDTKSIVGGVENDGLFSSDISSVKGHTSAVVHASGQNEKFKADTHNLSKSFSEEGSTTNLGSSSSKVEVASSVVAPEYTSHSTGTIPVMDNKDTKSILGGVESERPFSSDISSVKGHTSADVHASGQDEEFKADTHNLSKSSSEEGSTTNLDNSSSEEEVAFSMVARKYNSHNTGTVLVMDNKDTKSNVGGVENEGLFSSDFSSMKGHTSAAVHAPGQHEEFKVNMHNFSRSSSEEGSTTNLGSSSSEEEVASSVVTLEYTSHSIGTIPIMDNKDTKSIVDGVESDGAFFSHISSVKGHTSAVVHALGENEQFKADTHNLGSSSSEEGFTTNVGSSSSEEEVASSVVAPLYSASAPEFLWSEVRPLDPSRAETGNEEESFCLVPRIHPSELEIVRKISEGGQAKIFIARLKHRTVVVKRYKDPNVSVADLQRQMEMVMKACEGRSESGLCKVIGVSRDKKGKALLVMPHMQCDLRNLIDSKRILSPSNKRDIMRSIARGLKNLHACGRIHKDVKASNILVNHIASPIRDGPRRIGPDVFGRERSLYYKKELEEISSYSKKELEITSIFIKKEWVDTYIGDYESVDGVHGTGFWRPPEVLKALRYGSPEDLQLAYLPAVDVYGFGMVLYELLTGQIPFQGHSLNDYDLVISGRRPDIPDDVSPEMRDLLLRCWHQDPHQRPTWTEIEIILHSAP